MSKVKDENKKWRVFGASFITYKLDALDFMLLALVLPVIITEFDLSLAEAGLLGTATLIGSGLGSIFLGWYSDTYGRKKALIASLYLFSILTAAIALSQGWWHILVLRFFAGVGIGGVWGVASAFINETWPPHQRGRAISFVMSAFPVGYGLAALLAILILPTYGWRWMFIFALVGIFVALYFQFFVPESKEWQRSRKERETIKNTSKGNFSLKEIFSGEYGRYTIFGTLACTFSLTAYWGINTWLPTYLVQDRGMSSEIMGTFIIIINLGMFIGYQFFGYLSDYIGGRKSLLYMFLLGALMIPVFAIMTNNTALLIIGTLLFVFFSFAGVFGSYFTQLYPTHLRSMGAGFCFNIGRGLSAFSPYFMGQIAVNYSFKTGIIFCAVILLLAGVMMLFLPETMKKGKMVMAETTLDLK